MADDSNVAPSRKALSEALGLAELILKEVELSEVTLAVAMLKTSRLARLLNDQSYQQVFEYEASGYPSTPDGISADVWAIAELAGRVQKKKEGEKGAEKIVERAGTESVEIIEQRILTSRAALDAARDPNVSVSSANPSQFVWSPSGNVAERNRIQVQISDDVKKIADRRGFLHRYVSRKYDELRFSGIADDIFARIRTTVDGRIGVAVPKAVQKFSAVYENLQSENPEDWANAVHSCRRILQDLADATFPPQADRTKSIGGKDRAIKLGSENYINRLIAYVEDNSASGRFSSIVGSSLSFLGDRLDAVFQAAQKGSHAEISSRNEADRYVVYTYMLVADLLSISADSPPAKAPQDVVG